MSQNAQITPRKLPIVLGIVLILLGGISMAAPLMVTIEIAWWMGVLLIVSGVAQVIHIYKHDPMRSRVGRIFLSALSIITGLLVMRDPLTGAYVITLLMAFYFIAAAIARIALAFERRRGAGKGWLVLSSIISLVLGVYLISTLSTSSMVIPGLFLGVDFIFYGIAFITAGGSIELNSVIYSDLNKNRSLQ